jgi:hypothetical protein
MLSALKKVVLFFLAREAKEKKSPDNRKQKI